jgi:hypothetical protein
MDIYRKAFRIRNSRSILKWKLDDDGCIFRKGIIISGCKRELIVSEKVSLCRKRRDLNIDVRD